jgi:hypothetical protein
LTTWPIAKLKRQWNCLKQFYHWKKNKSKQFLWANCQDTFIQCRERAKERHLKRREDEKYLGKKSFSDEIHHSFNEFLVVVKSSIGFLPYDYSKQLI